MVRLRAGAAVACALVLATGCSGDDGAEGTPETTAPQEPIEPQEVVAGDEAFYEVPDPIPPGEHGDLVRHQLTGSQPDGATRHRVMYLSETPTGEPTVVTGLVVVPDGPAPPEGWPIITYARGSSGLADDCAISRAVDGMLTEHSDLAAEALLLEAAAVREGFVAALTDYQGIGGPGIHLFIHGVSEARSTLDILRAADDLPGLELDDDVGIMGYSQGGHAALWANQEAEAWVPELTVHGTVAGAPASEVPAMVAPGALLDGGSLAMIVAGFAEADPDLDLDEVLTPEGHELVERFAESCRPEEVDVADLASAELFVTRPEELAAWRSMLEAQVPGQVPGTSPVLLVHGDADLNVAVADSEVLRARLCGEGTPTERRVVPGANHVAGAVPTVNDGAVWLLGLIDGTQTAPTC